MLPNMTYDRSERQYRVTLPETGEVVQFPAGRDGRQAAFKMSVAAHSLKLYRLATARINEAPLLESRVWRACELVLNGDVTFVEPDEMPPAVATVTSNNEYGAYIVSQVGNQWLCECEDWTSGMCPADATGPRCKHTLAVEFAAEMRVQLRCYHCEAANDLDADVCVNCGEDPTPF